MVNLRTYLILLLFAPLQMASAGLAESYGVGGAMTGQAGAGVASVGDWSSAYYNAAGIASPINSRFVPVDEQGAAEINNQAGASMGLILPAMYISNAPGSPLANNNANIAQNLPMFSVLHLGAILDLRNVVATPRNVPVKIGLVVNQIGDGSQILRLEESNSSSYRFQNLGRSAEKIGGFAALAIQPWKNRLSIGAGVNFSANVSGKVQISNLSANPNSPPHIESDLKIKLNPTPVAGLQFMHQFGGGHSLEFGVAFRAESQVSAVVEVSAELPVTGLYVTYNTAAHLIQYYTPNTYTAGFSYANRHLRVSLDGEFQEWSRYRLSATRQLREDEPAFRNTLSPRVGVTMPIKWAPIRSYFPLLRGGYSFVPAMTPDQKKFSNYLDNARHSLGTGFGFRLPKSKFILADTFFDISLVCQIAIPRSTEKEQPRELADGSFQPNYSYGGVLYAMQISATLAF